MSPAKKKAAKKKPDAPVEEVDPDDLAPDADEDGDEFPDDLKDFTQDKPDNDDEVDAPDLPRTFENRRAAQ